jgi:hypothetical protein
VRRILSVASKPVGQRESFLIFAVEDFRSQYARRDTGAQCADPEMRAFLIGPDDDFEWMSRADVTII